MAVLDSTTPREVWQEYEERKRAMDAHLSWRAYEAALDALALELGCGVATFELTADQRAAQLAAIAKHGGRCDR